MSTLNFYPHDIYCHFTKREEPQRVYILALFQLGFDISLVLEVANLAASTVD